MSVYGDDDVCWFHLEQDRLSKRVTMAADVPPETSAADEPKSRRHDYPDEPTDEVWPPVDIENTNAAESQPEEVPAEVQPEPEPEAEPVEEVKEVKKKKKKRIVKEPTPEPEPEPETVPEPEPIIEVAQPEPEPEPVSEPVMFLFFLFCF